MQPNLCRTLETNSQGLADRLTRALQEPIFGFKKDLYPRLCEIDMEIPGIGTQYALRTETEKYLIYSGL